MMLGKRGALRVLSFFLHISNSIAGAFLGCRELPAPRRAPERLPQNAAGGTGYWNARPGRMCATIETHDEKRQKTTIRERGEQNENDNSQWTRRERWRL